MTTTTTAPPLSPSPASSLPIADVRYLWTEVERLKSQVHHLQQSDRNHQDEQRRLQDYVGSFVTQAQLDAALCTKISQSSVASSMDCLRGELLDHVDKKADVGEIQAIQSKKLDISVYESSTWDLKKFRNALEQNVRDLFSQFAHQIESQVNSKLSIEDFDRIFNPEANGQKAAIETAAARIARMKDQLDSLHEYVQSDRQRQHKVADMNVSLLDLTRKQNASRNSIAQIFSAFETSKERALVLEAENKRVCEGFEQLSTRVGEFQSQIASESTRQQQQQDKMKSQVDSLASLSQQTTQTLAQIQQFTQHTLLKGLDAKLHQMKETTAKTLRDAQETQQTFRQQTSQQVSKLTDCVTQTMDDHAVLESRLTQVEAVVVQVKDELASVKGPLLTVMRNLREENVAIQEEIRRSHDESRGILIDYKGLLEKESTATPSSSSSSSSRSGSALALPVSSSSSRPASSSTGGSSGRKYRHQQINQGLAARMGDQAPPLRGNMNNNNNNNSPTTTAAVVMSRPHTSNGRLSSGVSSATNRHSRVRTASVCGGESFGGVPQRPKSEAGPRPKKKSILYTLPDSSNSESKKEDEQLRPETLGTSELFIFPSHAISFEDQHHFHFHDQGEGDHETTR